MQPINVGIADDSREFCELLDDFLSSQPELHVAGLFHTGTDVVKRLPAMDLDVLLLDLIMPELDGLAVLEWLKGTEMRKKPKTIVFSAFAQEDIARNIMTLGANYYILKPFDLDILVKRITEIAQTPTNDAIYRPESTESIWEAKIVAILQSLSISPHLKGFSYLRDAIAFATDDPGLIKRATKQLYPKIAAQYQVNAFRVERAMRFAIETAWNRSDINVLQELFGYCVDELKGKPTNVSFIAKIADKLRLEKKNGIV